MIHKHTNLKTILHIVLISTIFLFSSNSNAFGQTEYWDTQSRGSSQNLSSSALNHLRKMVTAKKRMWTRKKKDELLIAIQILERAIVVDPTDALPHYLLGIALCMEGKYEKALPALQRANKLDPNEDEILLAAGLAQHLTGDYEKAFSIWSKLLGRTKRKAPIYVCIGHAQLRAGALEDALDSFTKAQSIEPGLQSAHEGMALVYFLAGDLSKAKSSFSHAQTVGYYPPVSLHLAEISYLEGDTAQAKKYYKNWRKGTKKFKVHKSMTEFGFSKQHDFFWDPFVIDRFDSYNAMVARQVGLESPKKAKSYAKRKTLRSKLDKIQAKIASLEDDFYLYHEEAILKLALQDPKGAIDSFLKAIKQCPDNRIDLIYLAMAFKQLGKPNPAWDYLAKYREIYPKSRLNSLLSSIRKVERKATPIKQIKPISSTTSGSTTKQKQKKKQQQQQQNNRIKLRPPIEKDPF